MYYLDWTLILLLPAVAFSAYAQWKVKSTFDRYSEVPTLKGWTGAKAAAHLARSRNIRVSVKQVDGYLSDHYDPREKSLALSPHVYHGRSVSSLGVAAHEFGHALQDAQGYFPLVVRSHLVPMVQFGSSASWVLFSLGLIMSFGPLLYLGIGLFGLAVLFSLVTLPVEFDASNRAMKLLQEEGIVSGQEAAGVRKVLNAAALTYVAAAVMSALQLLRMILIVQSARR